MKSRCEPGNSEPAPVVEAFVLAGARVSGDPLAEAHNLPSKAHIKIAGTSMISRVLSALSKSQTTGCVTVIGLENHHALQSEEAWPPVNFAAGGRGPAASVNRRLNEIGGCSPLLVTTCDHALLTPVIIDAFLEQSIASNADLTVALSPRELIERHYPETRRTYLRFGDGEYSSCNLFCLLTPKAQEVVEFWQDAEQDRKHPWKIAWRFGVISALRILVGRPRLEKVFSIISSRLGVTIHPIVLPFAEAAIDIDTGEDLALVERIYLAQTG